MAQPLFPNDERGLCIALIHALVAENLSVFYEHAQWLTPAQGASLAADWLNRSKRAMALADRRTLADLGSDIARQIGSTLSREAGLFLSHELSESLDPNYHSEASQQIMAECELRFAQAFELAAKNADEKGSRAD